MVACGTPGWVGRLARCPSFPINVAYSAALYLTYADQRSRALESLLVTLASGSAPDPDSPEVAALGSGMPCLARMLDLSMLKFNERDLLVEAVHKYRKQARAGGWGTDCRGLARWSSLRTGVPRM